MENITLRNGEHYIAALLRHSPVAAARNGLLALVHDGLSCSPNPASAAEFAQAAAPLTEALDVADVYAIDGALAALKGRPPAAVMRALLNPALLDALCCSLDSLGAIEQSDVVSMWGPRNPVDAGEAPPLDPGGWAERGALVDALRVRVGELLDVWRTEGMTLSADAVYVDGRSLTAAARAWQVPMITGVTPDPPVAAAALHPNRLGRTAAVVAYSRISSLVRSTAPDAVVFEALAMLVAVGEAISRPRRASRAAVSDDGELRLVEWDQAGTDAAARGALGLQVRVGQAVGRESMKLEPWWPVFSSWGSTSRRLAAAVPTAWKLSEAEGDVLVWALCSAAVRIAAAGACAPPESRRRQINPPKGPEWDDHGVSVELPRWEAGARSVWTLMQRSRRFAARSAFPGHMVPLLDVDHSWPWRPAPTA